VSVALACALVLALGRSGDPRADFEQGVQAYRSADYAGAIEHWQATLGGDLDELGRARVYHDLGNAYWRSGDSARAIACYTAALRLDPRLADARQNLELARAKGGLAPADTGDLSATTRRVLDSLRPDERRNLLLGALLLWALVLLLEVRWGGAAARGALVVATLVLALAAVPWLAGFLARERHAPMLVIASNPVALRSEPLEERAALGELASLEEVERIDALPGWVRIERADGQRGWVREENLFALHL